MGYIKNPSMTVNDDRITLDDIVLIDFSDRKTNFSRVSGHKLAAENADYNTISDLISLNYKKHSELKLKNTPEPLYYAIVDTLLTDFFMQHGDPLKVCELGCNNGLMSFHIAPLLAEYDPKADYMCVCNTIGNESGNDWLDYISSVKAPEGLSMIAADFSHTMLQADYFDVTVINGTVTIDDPMNTIKEAVRITKPDGRIICFSHEQYLLEDSYKLAFNNLKEYKFNEQNVIFSSEKKDAWDLL